ncbi:MAG: type VI secretion system protein TssA [Pigmentiphaga sp.]|uniref:type VI secretion system protein TssA n=1 Tax=Pigmentiphaga sp. TaxID=1977564 RepID=UPI0029BDCE24|nr:type VI secretion system protein TssA [Pigmentiphaga sp.]MDX3905797.1 type VI secretion system protein TssA [Pigmentiphaga sp.]
MHIDLLLEPLSPETPCGDNLEYDADFLALQQSIVVRGEQQFGTTIIPAEAPAWNQVEKGALALLARTRDIRVAVWLTHAWTELHGLAGYAQGAAAVRNMLERFWDTLHPTLDVDGEIDPMPRMNAIEALADAQGIGRSVRTSTLLTSTFGAVSLRDAESLLDGSRQDSQAYPGGRSRLVDDLRRARHEGKPELADALAALDELERIRALCSDRLGVDWAPQFAGVARTLGTVRDAVGASQPEPAETAGAPASAQEAAPPEAGPAVLEQRMTEAAVHARWWRDAVITDRADAVAMLEKVCSYFETNEPSHPAPFLIRRVQRLASANFQELVRDLAPAGLTQFETLAGPGSADAS